MRQVGAGMWESESVGTVVRSVDGLFPHFFQRGVQMNMMARWVGLSAVFLACCSGLCADAANGQITDEMVAGWKEMEEITSRCQIVQQWEENSKKRYLRLVIQGDLMKAESLKAEDNGPGEAFSLTLKNRDGVYELQRIGDAWQLVEAAGPDERWPQVVAAYGTRRIGYQFTPSYSLLDVVENPSKFQVLESKQVDEGWLLHIKGPVGEGGPDWTVKMLLDPDKRYRIKEAHFDDGITPGDSISRYEYSDDSLIGEVFPSRRYNVQSGRGSETISMDRAELPEEEFTLEYYGIPRYQVAMSRSGGARLWFWLLLAALLAAVVAVALRMRKGKG